MTLPEFLTNGEPVVELFSNAAHPVEILRTTTTQVVIRDRNDSQRRFRAAYGRVIEIGKDPYQSSVLVPANDPRVAAVKREKAIENARSSVRLAAEARPMYGHGDLSDLIAAVAEVRAVAEREYRILLALTEGETR